MKLIDRLLHVAALVLLTLVSNAFCQSPLPKRFGHTFEELQDEANIKLSNDPKFGREQLVLEYKLTFNEKGAGEESVREVWVSRLKDTGAQGTIQRSYSPWYQNQPSYSARIFDRSGNAYEVKEEDIIVSSIQSEDRTVLSDDMILQAVLPGLQEGGIVEELAITSERAPFFKSGTMRSFQLDTFIPTHYLLLEIEAPEDLPLNVGILGPEVPIQQEIKDGKKHWKVEIQKPRLVDITKLEGNTPANTHQLSSLIVTTGQSWNSVASEYSNIVDQKLKDTDFASILAEIDIDKSAPLQSQVEKCKQWIQNNIRYTSVALGSSSIIPVKPLQVLTKRFGDCKDQSSLLVGMLRALNIEAYVVLVNSSTYRAPYETFPALNSFDHAIVVALCDDREVWIDCTFPGSNALAVPAYLQGKNVLIASSKTQGLWRIPASPKETNRFSEERVVRIAEDRSTYSMEVSSKSSGFFAAEARNEALSFDKSFREKERSEQYRSMGGNPEYKIESEDDPWNDTLPEFRSATKSIGLPFTIVNQSQRRIILSMRRAFDRLPEAYLMLEDESGARVERKNPSLILVPFSFHSTTLIPSSAGINLLVNENRFEEKIGPVSIRKSIERRPNGDVFLDYELACDSGELSVANLEQLAKILKEMDAATNRWMTIITVETGSDAEVSNVTANQLIELRKAWQLNDSDDTLSKYVDALFRCGLIGEARSLLEESARKTPDRLLVLNLLGQSYLTNRLGRDFEPDFSLALAEEAFRKVITLDPNNRIANHFLANCLARDVDGTLGTTEEREKECLEFINRYRAQSDLSDGMFRLAVWLNIKRNDFQSARDILRKYNRELEEQSAQLVEWSLQENWNEVSALRDRLADDPQSLKAVFEEARQNLFNLRQYKAGGKLLELETPNDAGQKRIATSVSNLRVLTIPKGTPTSPKEVAMEVVYRVLRIGLNTNDWGSFTLNPTEPDLSLQKLDSFLAVHRNKIRFFGLNRDRIFDSLEMETTIDGTEEIGFRCETKLPGFQTTFFVLKVDDQYKLLLQGKQLRFLIDRAREFAKNGNNAAAVKWTEWIMKEIPDGIILIPESYSPAKTIWNSSKTKSPELVDRVLEMLDANGAPEDIMKKFNEWIAAEKSRTKKTYYHRALLDNLFKLNRPLFAQETDKFLQEKDGYLDYKTKLIVLYTENEQLDLASERLNTWKQELPSSLAAQFEAMILFHRGMKPESIQALKEAALLYGNEELWNSLLWTALFTDYPIQELWAESKDRFDPKKVSIATLHTIACVKAQIGAISDAMEDLNTIVNRQGNVVRSADWLVFGMIAEQCGFVESAKDSYERVEIGTEARSAYELAQLRLKMLPENDDAR